MKKIYEIGTLKYSFLQMMLVFFWMLWGTFAMSVLATVFNVSVPFLLRDNGMSDAFIVVMLSSVVGIMNMIMNPILSFNSDRCRSRLGRRIPFILYTAVPLGVAMAYTPASSEEARMRSCGTASMASRLTVVWRECGTMKVSSKPRRRMERS